MREFFTEKTLMMNAVNKACLEKSLAETQRCRDRKVNVRYLYLNHFDFIDKIYELKFFFEQQLCVLCVFASLRESYWVIYA